MSVIYLRHPVHGVKVASMDLEADADVENGWERFDPSQPAPDDAIVRRRGRRLKVYDETEASPSNAFLRNERTRSDLYSDAVGDEQES